MWNYLIAHHDTDDKKGILSGEEIAAGIYALDDANGLDCKLDLTKLDEKTAEAPAKPPEAKAKREKVADKDEDQNGTKASLNSEDGKTKYHNDWTAYVKALDQAQGATKDGIVKDAGDIKAMFGLTDAAAEAVFNKAKEFKPNDITDGVGCVLQDIDQHDGAWDGKITIGKFNDYVEALLKADPAEETQKKETEKSEKSSKGGGGSTSKVEINNPSNTETKALEEKIAALEKEITELKKQDEKPAEPEKKKIGNKGLFFAGAGILTGLAAFFAIRNRNDQQRYNNQMAQYQQQCGPKPLCPPSVPFCPPQPGFGSPPIAFQGQFQGQLQGPANPPMFA
ncbi:MAG: hypothetical protein QE263_00765 [Vampirovibrionales bacterium]|nr:hypothetical protein [Vampirovibrionales bacterium]